MTNKDTIYELFSSFEGKRLLIIGDVMIDSYLRGNVERVSPEAPVPIVSLKNRENRLGGAANVALNIQNMGGVPVLCSVIGQDDYGQQFIELLNQHGLGSEGIFSCKDRVTTVKFRVFGNNVQILRIDEELAKNLSASKSRQLLDRIALFLEQEKFDVIVFEDYDKGIITPGLIDSVMKLSEVYNIPVVVDPKKKNFSQYRGVHLFKPNLKELREGLQLNGELADPDQVRKAVLSLQDKLKVGTVLATLSEKGIYYSEKDIDDSRKAGHIPACVRDVADVSGAGDTVIALAALCVAAGAPVELMARICNLAGGLVCELVGVVPVDRDKLLYEAQKKFCQE